MKNNPHRGTHFYDDLREEGSYDRVQKITEELSEKYYGDKKSFFWKVREFLSNKLEILAIYLKP